VKLLLEEPGTAGVQAAWRDAGSHAASVSLIVEARAGLAAARRVGRQTAGQHRTAIDALGELWLEVEGIELTEGLAFRAGELAEIFALRGYDAVHLASAEAIADDDTILITSDQDLASAAASLGLVAVVPAA